MNKMNAVILGTFLFVPNFLYAAGPVFTGDLQYGMKNDSQVRELQDYLRTQGDFDHVTTGNFVDVTLAGVKAWQTANCVPSTGYFGPISRRVLANGSLCAAVGTPATPSMKATTAAPTAVSATSQQVDASGFLVINGRQYVQTTAGPVLMTGGGSFSDAGPAVSVSVSPSSASMNAFATTSFGASILGSTNTGVTWSASGGSINSSGVYTAPSPSATTTYTITARSLADSTRSSTASVTVSPIVVSVSPSATTTLGGFVVNFSASVANATSSAVTWSANGGSISSNGAFSAPGVTATTTYVITASSTVDGSRAGTALVTVNPNNNFVGWWKLDEGTSTFAYDISGHGNDGTWSGTPIGNTGGYYDTAAAPNFAYAGAFNGSDDLVTIPNINIGAAETISFWAYIPTLSGDQELVSKSSAGQGVEFLILNNTMTFYVMGSAVNNAAADPSDIHLNAWNYITGTYAGPNSLVTLYINGVQSGTTTTAPSSIGNVNNLYFGNWTSGGRWFTGKLDDVRMYTNEFTPEQVLDLYNSLR